MKEYKRRVLWLDYFNSALSRGEGRRVPLDRSVKEPKLDELVEATKRLGYNPETTVVKHPKRVPVQTGYVSVEKKAQTKKGAVMLEVAKVLSAVRGERVAAAAQVTAATASSRQAAQGQQLKGGRSKDAQQSQKR